MANVVRLDRLNIEGLDLVNAWVECTVSAIERALNVQGSGGAKVERTATGLVIKVAPAQPIRIMSVTTSIPAKSGSTAGKGAAKDCLFSAPTAALTASTGLAFDVYSYHTDKAFNVGAVIAAFEEFGVLWAFDVDACTNLT